MNPLVPKRTGYNLHWPRFVAAPFADGDLGHAAVPRGKQRCVPGKQTLLRERHVELTGRVKHHLDDAVNVASRSWQAGYIKPQPPRD